MTCDVRPDTYGAQSSGNNLTHAPCTQPLEPDSPRRANPADASPHPRGPLLHLGAPLPQFPGRRLGARRSAAPPPQLGVDHTVRFAALVDVRADHRVELLAELHHLLVRDD